VTGRENDIAGKCVLRLEPGERLIFDTPGGGGFGNPVNRAHEKIQQDIKTGNVSPTAALQQYDYDIT